MVIMKLAIGVSLQVSFEFPRVIGSPGNSIVQFLVDHQVARWTGWFWWHLMGRRCQDMEMIYLKDQLQWLLFWLKWPVFHDFDMYSCIAVLYYNTTWHTTWIKRNEEIQILWQKMITWGFIGMFMSSFQYCLHCLHTSFCSSFECWYVRGTLRPSLRAIKKWSYILVKL